MLLLFFCSTIFHCYCNEFWWLIRKFWTLVVKSCPEVKAMNTFISWFSFLLFYFEKLSQPRVVLTLLQNLMMMIMMMMMMMMMMTCFCGMVNRQNAFSRISPPYLRHTTCRAWTCAKPGFRLYWIKLCSSDNHLP